MISVLIYGFLWWSSISEPRWQRDRVQQCTITFISHTIAISEEQAVLDKHHRVSPHSRISRDRTVLLYRSVAVVSVPVKNPPNGAMVLPFTVSACRTGLWPFQRHLWQWRRETHEEKPGWKWPPETKGDKWPGISDSSSTIIVISNWHTQHMLDKKKWDLASIALMLISTGIGVNNSVQIVTEKEQNVDFDDAE